MSNIKKTVILEFIIKNPLLSSKEIHNSLKLDVSYSTLKRILTGLIDDNLVIPIGDGKARKYTISHSYSLLNSIDVKKYFEKEIDERVIKATYNFNLISEILSEAKLFTEDEMSFISNLQNSFTTNIEKLTDNEYKKEFERLAIDLSWKSSQIEGNTYTLLETERLLKEKETAEGKTKDDAIMLLNHKEAIDFLMENRNYMAELSVSKIEDIHSLLIKELGVDSNIRKRKVGITGTNYTPLDNEFQLREALEDMCKLINNCESVFDKALFALVLISYIQPFNDGNKRTARIISNAILMNNNYCPISFRTVDSIEYKKAMLIFYEQNNISAFKKIFIEQFEFAVKTYF